MIEPRLLRALGESLLPSQSNANKGTQGGGGGEGGQQRMCATQSNASTGMQGGSRQVGGDGGGQSTGC